MNSCLRSISAGAISGTNSIECPSEIFGGCLISADGTNAVTVTVRKTDAAGAIIFQITTKTPLSVFAPFQAESTVYTVVSGTGGTAHFYEWFND